MNACYNELTNCLNVQYSVISHPATLKTEVKGKKCEKNGDGSKKDPKCVDEKDKTIAAKAAWTER